MINNKEVWKNRSGEEFSSLYAKMFPEYTGNDNKIPTKNITFVVTEDCSLRCTYCYQCNKNFKSKMTKETAKKAVDMLFDEERMNGYIDYDVSKACILEFIGGEPLLEVELIDYIVDYFKYKAFELNSSWATNYMISITSNGIAYNDEKVQRFIEKNKDRLSLSITIDGNKELHDSCRKLPNGKGSYDIVYKNIKLAQEQINLNNTKVTLAPENIPYLCDAITHLFNIGFKTVNANCVFEDVWNPDRDTPVFYNQLIKLADYIINNNIYEKGYCSIFQEHIGQPMSPEENNNWLNIATLLGN